MADSGAWCVPGNGRSGPDPSRWKCVLGVCPDTMQLCQHMARTAVSQNGPREWFRTVVGGKRGGATMST